MRDTDGVITTMPEIECWERLRHAPLGRLGLVVASELRLTTWLPTATPDVVRIDVASLAGRSFSRVSNTLDQSASL